MLINWSLYLHPHPVRYFQNSRVIFIEQPAYDLLDDGEARRVIDKCTFHQSLFSANKEVKICKYGRKLTFITARNQVRH